jgi:hypothetical protein
MECHLHWMLSVVPGIAARACNASLPSVIYCTVRLC